MYVPVFQMEGYAKSIQHKNIPALFVSTKSDTIVQPEVAIKMSRACGLTEEQLVTFDKNEAHVSGPNGEETLYINVRELHLT